MYSWNIFISPNRPEFAYRNSAWFMLSLLIYMNVLNLAIFTELISGYGFNDLAYFGKIGLLVVCFLVLFFNYFFLVRGKKYIKIINEFQKESENGRIIGNILTWLFIIGTFLIGFGLLTLLRHYGPLLNLPLWIKKHPI